MVMTSKTTHLDDAGLSRDGDFVVLNTTDAEGYSGADLRQLEPKNINKILKWLSPTNYSLPSSEYGKHLQSHLAGTGDWIFATDQYRQWHGGRSGSLWIKAIAGAGKSVLAANIVSKLTRENQPDAPVLYFFFRHIVSANQKPQSLVRDYMAQLLLYSPALQHNLFELIDSNRSLDSVSFDELWNILTSAMTLMPRVYCVADALDEMDTGNELFLQDLIRLGKKKPGSIKLLMTSRPVPRVEHTLRDSSVAQIMLLQHSIDPDIALFVRNRLGFYSGSSGVREKIYRTMCSKANGHFLYARLMMDNLLDPSNNHMSDETSMLRALDQLPAPMADMYTQMLLDHSMRSGVSQDLQILLLTWVTRAEKPLRLLELSNIVSLEKLAPGKDAKHIVREGCGPLLEILEDETVCPIHHSLTEYLYDQTRKEHIDFPSSFPVLDYTQCQRTMTLSCLKFLVSGWHKDWVEDSPGRLKHESGQNRGHDSKRKSLKLKNPFMDYAAKYWSIHALKHNGRDDTIFNALDDFLTRDINIVLAIREYLSSNDHVVMARDGDSFKPSLDCLPSLIAAEAGLSHYLKHLIKHKYCMDCRDEIEQTPIALAASNGHKKAVAVLLKAGAKNNEDDRDGHKPLHYAAMKNHYQIVRLLLDAGVDCLTPKTKEYPGRWCGNSPTTVGMTPLKYACESGHVETIQEMIPYLGKNEIHSALACAISNKRTKAAMKLLEVPGVEINERHNNQSLLYLAAQAIDLTLIKELFNRGANAKLLSGKSFRSGAIDCFDPWGCSNSPLQAFARSCNNNISVEDIKTGFSYFLDAGLDINTRSASGATVLHDLLQRERYSNDRGQEWVLDVLKFLVRKGLNVHSQSSNGSSALHLIHSLSPNVVCWLIDQGLDVNKARIIDGQTPLMVVLSTSMALPQTLVTLLISRGADVHIRDRDGRTALHHLFRRSIDALDLSKTLISAGADINAQDNNGRSPIFLKSDYRETDIRFWLDCGLNLNQRDTKGNTVIASLATKHSSIESFKILIKAGADIHTSNSQGLTILHLLLTRIDGVVFRKTSDQIRGLVDEGVDPFALDNRGNNLWHRLVLLGADYQQREQLAVMQLLKKLKVPPNAKNYFGQTPLQLSFSVDRSRYPYGPTEFLIEECNANINAADWDGVRAIHLASSFDFLSICDLLNLDADTSALTKEGQNCLMIACRARRCDIVGRLLDHLKQTGQASSINLKDFKGRTALHYACKSGRPESVELLLSAGADVNVKDKDRMTPLLFCAEYQEEERLWNMFLSKEQSRQNTAGYILSDSKTRPSSRTVVTNAFYIRDTIRLLVDFGADVSFLSSGPQWTTRNYVRSENPLLKAIDRSCEPMTRELLRIQESLLQSNNSELEPGSISEVIKVGKNQGEDENVKIPAESINVIRKAWSAELRRFETRVKMLRSEFMPQIIGDCLGTCSPQTMKRSLIPSLLEQEDEAGVEQISESGVDFTETDDMADNIVFRLARHGHTALFRKTGRAAAKMTASWAKETALKHDNWQGDKLKPILHVALSTELPNLRIVKFLVEDLKLDINEQVNGEFLVHYLVGANRSFWWHTKALEYLISRGLDIECLDDHGDTPLIRCLRKTAENLRNSPVQLRMIDILLNNGANPNAMDARNLAGLNIASKNKASIELLLKHNASPFIGRQPFIFDAISTQNIDALKIVLESRPDVNLLPLPLEESKNEQDPYGYMYLRDVEFQALYPLEQAAMGLSSSNPRTFSKAVKMCQMLLDAGADIRAQYEDGSVVLHNLVLKRGMLELLSTHPTFDAELRDAKGRTLILAASDTNYNNSQYQSSDVSKQRSIVIPALLRLGSSLQVEDQSGRNVLHCLLSREFSYVNVSRNTTYASDEWAIASTLLEHKLGSKLSSQADAEGRTPLHYALQSLKLDFVDLFVSHGADPFVTDPRNGYTALHYITQGLISYNDHLFHEEYSSGEELSDSQSYVARSPQIHFSKLVQRGVDVNATDALGETPLLKVLDRPVFFQESYMYCTVIKSLRYLEKMGANLHARSTSGESILHKFARIQTRTSELHYDDQFHREKEASLRDAFEWVVGKGVDVAWEDDKNRTCLDVAAAVDANWVLELYKRKK